MLSLKVAWRFIFNKKQLVNTPTLLSILGMAIGVSCLLVTMGVISGYESTLRQSILDVTGDVFVLRKGNTKAQTAKSFVKIVKKQVPEMKEALPFVYIEALLPRKGKVAGVFVEGVDENKINKVLKIKNRIQKGELDLGLSKSGLPKVLIGKSLAKKFQLDVGSEFHIVIPMSDKFGSDDIKPKVQKFYVSGILNIGRFDYDNRYILTSLKSALDFSGRGKRITGIRLLLKDYTKAPEVAFRLTQKLGEPFWARSWYDVNRNLFEAVKLEKKIIFIVLLIIVLVACLNVASTLFVIVLRRYRDISILKSQGAKNSFFINLFSLQGLFVGLIGVFLGVILAFSLAWAFESIQETWNLIPAETYKLDHIKVEFLWSDILMVLFASIGLCFLSTLIPSYYGAKMQPTQGLKYE